MCMIAGITCAVATSSSAQSYASATTTKKFYTVDEYTAPEPWSNIVIFRDAKFEGGEDALEEHLEHHFVYPQIDISHGVEGKVVAKFTIEENGQVSDAYIVKSVSQTIDKAFLLAIETMPSWVPAMRDGVAVKSTITLPFKASLNK